MVFENASTPQDATGAFLQDIQLYYTPILLHLGVLGNCLSVCVFFGTKLRHASSSIYLGALAISDTGFLMIVFIAWIDMLHVHLLNKSGFCQFFVYFSTLCSFLSVWLVVAFTVERYVAVKYPLRRQFLCTVTRAKIVVIGLTTLAILLCSPVLLFAGPVNVSTMYGNQTICDLSKGWKTWAIVYNTVDTVLTFAVPLTMIIIFNILIAHNIYKLNKVRRTLTIESDVSNRRYTDTHDRDRTHIKVTKMLLLVSTAFLCLNMPAFVLRVIVFFYDNHQSSSRSIILAQQMCNLLFDTSFGINFILYCVSGQKFRRAIVQMFMHRSGTRRNRTLTQMTSCGKECISEITHKLNSRKRLHSIDAMHLEDSQKMQGSLTNDCNTVKC